MIGLVGGKWTTFRALAEQATDEVLRQLHRPRVRSTEGLPIGGGAAWPADGKATDALLAQIQAAGGMSRQRASDLLARYGTQALALAERLANEGDAPSTSVPGYSAAELRYLCQETGVAHLDDLVIRRTLLAISGQVTEAVLAELAQIAAEALGWDAERQSRELGACATLLRERHGVSLAAAMAQPRRATNYDSSWPVHPLSSSVPT
jgi:glycerol-3-phosphate dehydrogenase